jgi:two-component system sensor histidine kinase YesM
MELIAQKAGFPGGIMPVQDSGVIIVNDGHQKYAAAWKTVPRLSMILIHANSAKMITGSITLMRLGVIGVYLLTIIVLFFITEFATGQLMKRLYSIMDGMKQVRSGNLDVQIAVGGDDEVTVMADTFTSMTEQIKVLIEKNRAEQKLVADTEIKAMQNQINSHFLYNVLETIKMQAELHDQHDIVESITVLGRMLRYCLRWRVQYVELQEEISYMNAYITILNIRNDYHITLVTNVDPAYNTFRIPKMLLQPLIENAFSYAVEPYGRDAEICLSCRADNTAGVLWLCVQDYGPGFSSERLAEIRQYLADETESSAPGRIGLKNIQQRLSVFYGAPYRVCIESMEGAGSCICVPVPFLQNQDTTEDNDQGE